MNVFDVCLLGTRELWDLSNEYPETARAVWMSTPCTCVGCAFDEPTRTHMRKYVRPPARICHSHSHIRAQTRYQIQEIGGIESLCKAMQMYQQSEHVGSQELVAKNLELLAQVNACAGSMCLCGRGVGCAGRMTDAEAMIAVVVSPRPGLGLRCVPVRSSSGRGRSGWVPRRRPTPHAKVVVVANVFGRRSVAFRWLPAGQR